MEFCSMIADSHFGDTSYNPRGISYGVFEMDYSKEINIEAALNIADKRMYENKNKRREKIKNREKPHDEKQ
ncbi:MAG: hypothetical protein LKJ13_00720 [Clostridia bacterium]|jgi:GGDEF domain-containing protein|nr:hypothetical protein [Clostridia bacterium]MCI1999408.1 hypothetical protein [Clostridia bacterium]MCI2015090.1 hypothetical protein [Clostridia bacterium]